MILATLALVVLAYFVGSLSPSLLLGKLLRGIDLREHGSGNLGTTNAMRALGKPIGIAVLVADLLKGFLPVFLAIRLLDEPWVTVLVALAAIAGHNYSIFLRGKGGKGVATGAGTLLAMVPLLLAVQLVLFAAVLIMTGYVSLASLAATVVFPLLASATGQPLGYVIFSFLGAAVVVWAHRANLLRLLRGTERRASFRWLRRRSGEGGGEAGPDEGAERVGDG